MSFKSNRYEVTVTTGEFSFFGIKVQMGGSTQTHKYKFDPADGDKANSAFFRAQDDALAQARAKTAEAINQGHRAVMRGPTPPNATERRVNGQVDAPDDAFKLL